MRIRIDGQPALASKWNLGIPPNQIRAVGKLKDWHKREGCYPRNIDHGRWTPPRQTLAGYILNVPGVFSLKTSSQAFPAAVRASTIFLCCIH